jgi:hypothetical protein
MTGQSTVESSRVESYLPTHPIPRSLVSHLLALPLAPGPDAAHAPEPCRLVGRGGDEALAVGGEGALEQVAAVGLERGQRGAQLLCVMCVKMCVYVH